MPKLTKRLVESLKPTVDGDMMVWDEDIPGFGVRLWPSGKRAYILKYRTAEGRQRKATIGPHGPFTAEQARATALRWLSEAKHGNDPATDKSSCRRAPTVSELAERYMAEHARVKKRLGSVQGDEALLRLHILPRLANTKVNSVTRSDISQLHHSMRKSPGAANRTLSLLSKMFNLAEKWGLRPDGSNPCRHVEKFRERKIERFLSADEFARLEAALAEAERNGIEMPSVLTAIRLLLLTGCRLSEILTLRWEDVDLDHQRIRLPDSKTGPKTVYLAPAAIQVLSHITQRPDNPFVNIGARRGSRLVNLQKPWRRIRKQAGLDDVRIHDLRHSFASVAAASGLSLPIIGALLGHSQPSTTQRYAHIAGNSLAEAANLVAGQIAAGMKRQK